MVKAKLIVIFSMCILLIGTFAILHAEAGSAEVKRAQELLTKLGYDPGLADGAWGGKSRVALNAFQNDQGFKTTSRLRADILLALNLVSDGAEKSPLLIAERVENTLILGNGIRIYYAPDGKKIARLKNGKRHTSKWRKKADGTFCEYLTRQKREVCDGNSVLISYKHEEKWFYFDKKGKNIFEIKLIRGNQLKP
jgi:peptidoglycan hydrolase-like protein with peptidoglycan-binding domain